MKESPVTFILSLLSTVLFFSCCSVSSNNTFQTNEISCENYRAAMREFVIKISQTARKTKPDFIVIPQNGQNVAWDNDDADELIPDSDFISAINGTGREDTFYGMDKNYRIADGTPTPVNLSKEIQELCNVYKEAGITILSIDYTKENQSKISDSYEKNAAKGYISFAATERALNVIPNYEPYNMNTNNIKSLNEAKNFLYLINPNKYSLKDEFIQVLENTDYDCLIIDLFCAERMLTSSNLQRLKTKKSGGSRLVICYMSIGEAEDYRWYWEKSWNANPPAFLCKENPEWKGNYKVKYWYPSWQNVIYGQDGYLTKIVNAGFDGVYLDIIDAFEYFEEQE
ncbi:putative extracellular endo alpha-1,4 polygalactosaminidase [Treponema sp. JC4]|uniref:endo alpha-1,4 polygalactosaminidase n=1 Tax=Treponema sp. JC4 TaxID=1124982 RepID=UPI00025B0CD5|nr:endo alpha-1,4 polygalactosaminidase [Treponema sp. JC4]EID83925.1 putative extracellular endo alpha-1,4 polygalactosaminidase [Treponema sp. JC4]